MDALNQGVHARCTMLTGLVTHSDCGSQYTSIRYTDRLAEIGAQPSIGSFGDSYDDLYYRHPRPETPAAITTGT